VALPQLSLWREGGLTHTAKASDSASAAPLDYFIPNSLHPVWGEAPIRAHRAQNFLDSTLYVGFVPLAIALFGWLVHRRWTSAFGGRRTTDDGRQPEVTQYAIRNTQYALPYHASRITHHASRVWLPWLALALVTAVLSLGLTLHDLQGQYRLPLAGGSTHVPMPGQILYDYLPFYSSMRAYARFGVMVALAVAVLMGLGWVVFLRGRRFRRNAAFFGTLAMILLLADLWSAPYTWGSSRVEPTEISRFIAGLPPGLVMQMPLESSQSGPALWWETYYGPEHPIAYGFDTFEPPEWRPVRSTLEEFPGK
jgi:hypothetical protein